MRSSILPLLRMAAAYSPTATSIMEPRSASFSRGLGANMAEGWETHRRRVPGNEWVLFALGHRGRIQRIEVDTTHFKGNYPDRCSVEAADVKGGSETSLVSQSMFWRQMLPEQKLAANMLHVFTREVLELGPVTHIRFNVIPDGGVNRLRIFGTLA